MVSFTHEQNISCNQILSQTQLDDIAQEQTIICRQLFADQVVGFRPIKKNLLRMIKDYQGTFNRLLKIIYALHFIMHFYQLKT